jgi:hypothetical protein
MANQKTANGEWRIANGKGGERRVASGERRKTANSEWRIKKRRMANSEWRMANGGIRVGAGSQPALPRHGEAVAEDFKPGRCNPLES